MEFRIEKKLTRLCDPRRDFAEVEIESEIRYDPLTHRSARICHLTGLHPVAPDYAALAATTRAQCPFCSGSVERVTPRFPASQLQGFAAGRTIARDGRLIRGEATLFPNLFPYDDISAVAALSHAHYLDAASITPALVADGIALARNFFAHAVLRGEGDASGDGKFGMLTWNYLPAAGASQMHPHMQVALTAHPGNAMQLEQNASRSYFNHHAEVFGDALIDHERDGPRWLEEDNVVAWMVGFTPIGMLGDVTAILPGKRHLLELSDDDIDLFAAGLVRMMRAFDRLGMPSFNLSLFPAAFGDSGAPHWLTARLLPRLYLNPATHVVDASYAQLLLRETVGMRFPELVAADLRRELAELA